MGLNRPLIQKDPHFNDLQIRLIAAFQIEDVELTHSNCELVGVLLECCFGCRLEHNRALHLDIPRQRGIELSSLGGLLVWSGPVVRRMNGACVTPKVDIPGEINMVVEFADVTAAHFEERNCLACGCWWIAADKDGSARCEERANGSFGGSQRV
jgi:hypothetical protein